MSLLATTETRPQALLPDPDFVAPPRELRGKGPLVAPGLGILLLGIIAFAAFSEGAIQLGEESDMQIALAVVGLLAFAILALGRGLRFAPGPGAVAGLALLAGFGAWCAFSMTWSVSPDLSWVEANRAFAYVMFAALALAVGSSLRRAPQLAGWGYLALASVVALYALGGKLAPWLHIPGVLDLNHTEQLSRLRAPFGYWNALALFCSLGIPIALRTAADAALPRAARLGALSAGVMILVTLALTYSRGGLAATVLAVGLLIAIGPDRLSLAAFAGISVLGALPSLLVAFLSSDLTTDELSVSDRTPAGLLLLLALGLGITVAVMLGLRLASRERPLELGPQGRSLVPYIGGGLLGLGVGVLILLTATGWVGDQVDSFTEAKAERDTDPSRIVSTNSGNRWIWWEEAAGAFSDRPIVGHGAGSFPLVHRLYRKFDVDARQPHNVPLEFLSETGVVGFGLAFGGLGLLVAAGIARLRRARGPDRMYGAALMVGVAAWSVHTIVDWDWDIPGATLPIIGFLGLMAARPPTGPPPTRRASFAGMPGARAAGLLAGGALIVLLGISSLLPALARDWSNDALALGAKGGTENLRKADEKASAARRIDPFALEPLYAAATLAERRGDVERAVDLLAEGIERQPENARAWLRLGQLLVRIDDSRGALAAALTALRLDRYAVDALLVALAGSYDDTRSASATGTPLPLSPFRPAAPAPPAPPAPAPAPAAPTTPGTPQAPAAPTPTPTPVPTPTPAPPPAPRPAPTTPFDSTG